MPAGKTSSPAGIFATYEAALLLGMAAEIHLSGVLTYGADLDPLNRHIAARHAAFGIRASVFQTDDLHVEEADVLAVCRSGMLTEIVRIHIVDSFDISLVVVVIIFITNGYNSIRAWFDIQQVRKETKKRTGEFPRISQIFFRRKPNFGYSKIRIKPKISKSR